MSSNIAAINGQCNTSSHDRRMTRKLNSKRELRAELEFSGTQHKALAIALDMDQGQLSRVLSDGCQEEPVVSDLPGITRELGPEYMQRVAIRCGGTYHHGEERTCLQAPTAVLVGLLAKGSQDNHWSPAERAAQVPGLRKLHSVIGAMLAQAEGGAE